MIKEGRKFFAVEQEALEGSFSETPGQDLDAAVEEVQALTEPQEDVLARPRLGRGRPRKAVNAA